MSRAILASSRCARRSAFTERELERIFVRAEPAGRSSRRCARFAEGRGVAVEPSRGASSIGAPRGGRHQGVDRRGARAAPRRRSRTLEIGPTAAPRRARRGDGSAELRRGDPQRGRPRRRGDPLARAQLGAALAGDVPRLGGAIEHAALCRVASLPEALQALADRGVHGRRARRAGDGGARRRSICAARWPSSSAPRTRACGGRCARACQHTARLPMSGPIGSLNASVAAAIALYEVVRQRRAAT